MDALTARHRHDEDCPLDTTLQILSGKWKSIILCRLRTQEMRFTELLLTLNGCTRRMLALQLSQLITDQIIVKTIDTSFTPTKTSYRLTALGQSLVPVVLMMNQWGTHYLNTITATALNPQQ